MRKKNVLHYFLGDPHITSIFRVEENAKLRPASFLLLAHAWHAL
jgi:hypothetical protein